jgi:FixJ family two-component response regulator
VNHEERRASGGIDDDPSMRIAIRELIESVGLKCQTFGTAHEFLEATLPDGPTCLVLDVRLPGLTGLNLQRELAERNIQIPPSSLRPTATSQ